MQEMQFKGKQKGLSFKSNLQKMNVGQLKK